jgi:ribose transport system substrate-binding protein
VTVGRDLVHHRTCFIGTNSFQAGYEAGRIIVRRVGDRARIGLIIAGETEKPDQQWNQNFTLAGLSNALKEAPGARVVAAGLSRDGILFGEETADELVGKNPGLNVIVCTSGKDTIGAAQTIIDLNRVGAVTIIGYDDDPEVLAFVRKGVVSATLVRNAEKTGYEAVRAIVAARDGKPVSDFIDTGITVVTPGSLAGTRDGSL